MFKEKLTTFITKHISPNFADEVVFRAVSQCLKTQNPNAVTEVHQIMHQDKVGKCVEGVVHEKFDTLLRLVSADLPVFLTGPAGSGKNHLCKQVAEALDLDFYFTNAVTQEYRLTGFIDANGRYHETQFYKAFKEGGLFFLDEMDASVPETLIILNAAIANRYFDFPIGKVTAHPNFRVIAAGNTVGTGSDEVYTGRYQLDGASLDRFSVVEIQYSEKIEKALTNNNNELLKFARDFRIATAKASINCICSYRALHAIDTLIQMGEIPISAILKMSLIKGLDKESVSSIVKYMTISDTNRYMHALKGLSV